MILQNDGTLPSTRLYNVIIQEITISSIVLYRIMLLHLTYLSSSFEAPENDHIDRSM
jgi:hypothetical protein